MFIYFYLIPENNTMKLFWTEAKNLIIPCSWMFQWCFSGNKKRYLYVCVILTCTSTGQLRGPTVHWWALHHRSGSHNSETPSMAANEHHTHNLQQFFLHHWVLPLQPYQAHIYIHIINTLTLSICPVSMDTEIMFGTGWLMYRLISFT